ncbi:MAG: UvrD-helicase domain-containing protein [Planctomycetaceae bacterium]
MAEFRSESEWDDDAERRVISTVTDRPRDLTMNQWQAVNHREGPLLVLAGPGSGKTRVITRRIARMVETGVPPHQILAMTFTNKAAGEMSARVAQLISGAHVEVTTFHRFCAKLLRRYGSAIGLQPNFSIYDTSDQMGLLREVLYRLDIDSVHYPPGKILSRISKIKNDLVSPEQFALKYAESIGNHWQAVVARVYPAYQQDLLAANAVDFDDLLLHVVTMLQDNPEIRGNLDERYRYVLVDEYQDTNLPQYHIVHALSFDYPNLCVTGDPDQSIYGWRGAQIENILRFERDFRDVTIVKLEQNYRSTKAILRQADGLIAKNVHRKHKELFTDNAEGEPVELWNFFDAAQEADEIAKKIRTCVEEGDQRWSGFAICYRVNSLSRQMEVALTRHRIPYQVAGGVTFYERAEIKDLIAYLRLIHNPSDQVAFLRAVNKPLRGIGKSTQQKLVRWAGEQGIPLLEAAAAAGKNSALSKRGAKQLENFAKLTESIAHAQADGVFMLLQAIILQTHFTNEWMGDSSEESRQRLANVEELLSAARQYDETHAEEGDLEGFLETTALASDLDQVDLEAGAVTLMTLHSAKGLEFPAVFILGVEQNLIPHERSIREGNLREIEEERRLLFVGMTRAEKRLVLTQTYRREMHGRPMMTIPSEFLSEMDLTSIDFMSGSNADAVWGGQETRWTYSDSDAGSDDTETDERHDDVSEEDQDLEKPLTRSKSMRDERKTHERTNTGAESARPEPERHPFKTVDNAAPPQPKIFNVGSRVLHPQHGTGTVVSLNGISRRQMVTVSFDADELMRTFITDKAPLEPLKG